MVAKGRAELLMPLALAAGVATLIQAATSYALSQMLGVAAQREIAEMRKRLQAHVVRLPTRFFDSAKSGELISRVMNDAEGIRNLVGTGLVQLLGGILTALLALGVLLWLNWRLTLANLVVLAGFGALLAVAFRRLRPVFRERSRITAEVSGRLGEAMGGVRVVKAYTAEPEEERVFAVGADRLFADIRRTMTGISGVTAASTALMGAVGDRAAAGRRPRGRGRSDDHRRSRDVRLLHRPAGRPGGRIASIGTQLTEAFAGLDRMREILGREREDAEDPARRPVPAVRGDVEFEGVDFEYEAGRPVLRGVSFHAAAGTPRRSSARRGRARAR